MNIVKQIFSYFKREESNISEHPDLFKKKSAQDLAEDYNDTKNNVKMEIEKEIENLIRKLSLIKDKISIEEDLKDMNYKKLLRLGRKKI